jgi:hypothetical protein
LDDDSPGNPVIFSVENWGNGEFGVSEAAMRHDLSDATFVVFHSAVGGGVNFVYQCPNGNIDWNDKGSRAVGHTAGVTAAVTD